MCTVANLLNGMLLHTLTSGMYTASEFKGNATLKVFFQIKSYQKYCVIIYYPSHETLQLQRLKKKKSAASFFVQTTKNKPS